MSSASEHARFHSPERASAILGVSVATVHRHLRAKTLVGIKVGRQWRIPESAITALEQRAIAGEES